MLPNHRMRVTHQPVGEGGGKGGGGVVEGWGYGLGSQMKMTAMLAVSER